MDLESSLRTYWICCQVRLCRRQWHEGMRQDKVTLGEGNQKEVFCVAFFGLQSTWYPWSHIFVTLREQVVIV
jgi:hypothetical protein